MFLHLLQSSVKAERLLYLRAMDLVSARVYEIKLLAHTHKHMYIIHTECICMFVWMCLFSAKQLHWTRVLGHRNCPR